MSGGGALIFTNYVILERVMVVLIATWSYLQFIKEIVLNSLDVDPMLTRVSIMTCV